MRVGPWRGAAEQARALLGSGLVRPARPDRLLGAGLALARYGYTLAAGVDAAAAAAPRALALRDEAGACSYRTLADVSVELASLLRERGLTEADPVALSAANGRAFVVAAAALSRLGADVVLCNPATPPAQLAGILAREGCTALLSDDAATYRDVVASPAVRVWDLSELHAAAVQQAGRRSGQGRTGTGGSPAPRHRSRLVILTSGTTGTPKGAARDVRGAWAGLSLLARIPLRAGEPTVVAAPMFHAWGLAHLGLGLVLRNQLVVRRRFDPEQLLADLAQTRATALIAVPVMLARMLELPAAVRARYDTGSLRVIAVSGSALPGGLATRVLAEWGPVLYNLYGSTEVAMATVAGPEDLAADPLTAGRPLAGVRLRLVDAEDRDVAPGTPGRLFVGNSLTFSGYTGGEDRTRLDGLVDTGDIGVIDAAGRLRLQGRDDDMIVSGGENVYPAQVQEVILQLPGVREAAVVGVDDELFGQRLAAYVVAAPGATVDPEALREHVRARLARHQVPREVHLVAELPRTATGKVLTRALAPPGDPRS